MGQPPRLVLCAHGPTLPSGAVCDEATRRPVLCVDGAPTGRQHEPRHQTADDARLARPLVAAVRRPRDLQLYSLGTLLTFFYTTHINMCSGFPPSGANYSAKDNVHTVLVADGPSIPPDVLCGGRITLPGTLC